MRGWPLPRTTSDQLADPNLLRDIQECSTVLEVPLASSIESREGGCLCGALRFRTRAQPVRLTICYCKFCQRATGSSHMVEPIFGQSDFEVITDRPTVFSLVSSGSGKRVDVHFCARCGTKINLTFERFPDVVGIYAGTFDDPSWFDRTPETTACLFLDSAAVGALVPAGVLVFHQHRLASDGSLNEALTFEAPFEVQSKE